MDDHSVTDRLKIEAFDGKQWTPRGVAFTAASQCLAQRRTRAFVVEVAIDGQYAGHYSYVSGFLTIHRAYDTITNDARIHEDVADAEIIVVYGNAASTAPNDMDTCARSGADDRDPPERHSSADLAPYGDVSGNILDTVFELRAGQPTVIRTYDFFSGALVDWQEAGIEPECTAGREAQADAIRDAADEYGVLTASFYDEFNGVNHDEDPCEKGYIAADGWHQSQEAGVAAQIEVLHALGYDPIIP